MPLERSCLPAAGVPTRSTPPPPPPPVNLTWHDNAEADCLRAGLSAALQVLYGSEAQELINRLNTYDVIALQRLEERIIPGIELKRLEET